MRKKKDLLISNELFSDFKATIKAADLIERGVDPDHIEFRNLGGGRRPFAREIQEVDNILSNGYIEEEYIRIDINREGLYDMLPEGLFHTLHAGTEILDEEIMIQDVKNKRRQEHDARKFFSPFENELFHFRLKLDQYEHQLDRQTDFPQMSNLLLENWKEIQSLNARQRVLWMHFIPEIQSHKNDIAYAQLFLGQLLSIPILLKKRVRNRKIQWHELGIQPSSLGNCNLGIDSITLVEYETDEAYIQIQIGPTYPQLLKNYLPNEKDEKIIRATLDYLLPASTPYEITYELLPEVKHSYLADPLGHSNSMLGHTSFL